MKKITLSFIFLWGTILSFAQTQIGLDLIGEASGDQFGSTISFSENGNIVAFGSYLNDDGGTDSGSVRVYQNVSGTWTQLGQDIDGLASSEQFGYSVSISADGTILAASAVNIFSNTTNEYVRVFKFQSGTWQQIGQTITDNNMIEGFGYNISLSADGNRVAVGKIFRDVSGLTTSGAVAVYENVANTWLQIGQEIGGINAADNAGGLVAMSNDGSVLAFTALGSDVNGVSSGQVRVFQYNSGSWVQLGQNLNGEFSNDASGTSISLSSDGMRLAVGEPGNDSNGLTDSGRVKVYQYENGTWNLFNQIIYGLNSGVSGEKMGSSVSLSKDGNVIAVGAPFNRENGSFSGRVVVYQNISNNWQQIGSSIYGSLSSLRGYSISLSGNGTKVATAFSPNKVAIYDLSSVLASDKFELNNFISVYPNPVHDILNVNISDNQEIAKIEILALDGRTVQEVATGAFVNLEHIVSGIYLVKITSKEGKTGVQRIIKK